MSKSKLSVAFTVGSLIFLLSRSTALAALVPCGGAGNPCTTCHFFLLAKNIFDFIAFSLTPPAAALMFIFGGVMFLTSAGNEDRLSKAKGIFWAAVIGILIVYLSWLIVDLIIMTIGSSTAGFDPQNWYKSSCQ